MFLSSTQVLFLCSTAAVFASPSCEVDAEDCDAKLEADGALHEVVLLQKDLQLHRRASTEQSVQVQTDGIVDDRARRELNHIDPVDYDFGFAQHEEADVTTTTAYNHSDSAAASGVKTNGAGDLLTFASALFTNIFMIVFCVGCFMFLKQKYPLMYSNNLEAENTKLTKIDEGLLGWAATAWRNSNHTMIPDVIEDRGLDMALALKFIEMAAKIMETIAVPMFLIMGPINCLFGGHAAGEDHLSYLSFGNVVNGSKLYWIHAFVCWGVVLTATHFIRDYQHQFQGLRQEWLQKLPKNRASTILVEGIPPNCQSEAQLEAFFSDLFGPNKVASVYLVKNYDELEEKYDELEQKIQALDRAQNKEKEAKNANNLEEEQKMFELARSIIYEKKALENAITSMQKALEADLSNVDSDYKSSSGFVTFKEVSDATLAMSVTISEDLNEWAISDAPDPSCVLWHDLQASENAKAGLNIVGYLLVFGLYMAYMPCVIGITQIAVNINMGPLQPMWAAFAPTMGLQFMVAFLPTFLIIIFRLCFTLRDGAFAQQRLQNWYFVFQMVFVILITAIGPHMYQFLDTLVEHPTEVFGLLGTTMPFATHFYMNYLVLQWASHSMVLMRYVPLGKYLFFKAEGYDEESARSMAEPEDQDYYGIGSRSCRMTINLCIGLVYGTLSPPINVLTWIEFCICRVVYGYLIPYAESKKPDLGGHFFVHQLKHTFVGLIIYSIVMTGVLLGRSDSNGPGVIALCTLPFIILQYKQFNNLTWEKLSYKELKEDNKALDAKRNPNVGEYRQPFMKKLS